MLTRAQHPQTAAQSSALVHVNIDAVDSRVATAVQSTAFTMFSQTSRCAQLFKRLSAHRPRYGRNEGIRTFSSATRRDGDDSDGVLPARHVENPSSLMGSLASDENSADILSDENTRDLPVGEVGRLAAVYSLVQEHVDVVEKSKPPLDPKHNPFIDPRSFRIRTLPRVPNSALKHFREELPATVAAQSRVVPTRGVWDNKSAASRPPPTGVEAARAAAWAAVDQRTMDPFFFARMRRQGSAVTTPAAATQATPPLAHGPPRRARRPRCRLSGPNGRVRVDFREVAVLREFVNEHGKIVPRRKSSLSAKAQRAVARRVKTARQMALLAPEPKPWLTLEEMLQMTQEDQEADLA